MQIVELPARVGPAGGQHDGAARGQPFDLQNALESFVVRGGSLCLTIEAVEVDGRRRIRPLQGARIDPQMGRLVRPIVSPRADYFSRVEIDENEVFNMVPRPLIKRLL